MSYAKIDLDGKEYSVDSLTTDQLGTVERLKFADQRLIELTNKYRSFAIAKEKYLAVLKKEVITNTSGFDFTKE